MPGNSSPELVDLFTTYTASADSLGAHLTRTATDRGAGDPLIVATSADFALYPGNGKPPAVEGFRFSTKGFKELAGISHLGPAVASLVGLKEKYDDDRWRTEAERLLAQVERARAANSGELWRDTIAVEAYRGREQAIADMIDYSCAVTVRYLRAALADGTYLTGRTLREEYLDLSINEMMIATFFLSTMDISFRVLRWFGGQDLDWARTMVLVAGRQGRVTSGVTWNTSSVATMIHGASRYQLPLERLYLAPHAPTFTTPVDGDLSEIAGLEKTLRGIWFNVRATVELGGLMFPDSPGYAPSQLVSPDLTAGAITEISEMPVIHGPDDWPAMITRLRMVLEDPRQLLSGCVTDYAVRQLVDTGNDPAKVVVPGLDNVTYPAGR
ncbi:DUF5624 domain-containing protein [Amycolatopsis pithecellobii]|uniref:DUF5624 domain-containing protein n=1 Tax=Amycolatopsis pithecellobii TaxID=664692 RepID=A0A6N7ZCV0_9PSEU|nr:DUF5624 domain-containing protein [Amycolatopsis pithecellobii]MTD59593.1 hypothetical protein [Amycolatopsis pithecellobii]